MSRRPNASRARIRRWADIVVLAVVGAAVGVAGVTFFALDLEPKMVLHCDNLSIAYVTR